LDLTGPGLNKRIVKPYHEGETFFCDNTLVDPFDIETIRINRTDLGSSALLPKIRAHRRQLNVVVSISDEWYVTKEGEDVTSRYIKHPPIRKGVEKKVDPVSSTGKIFIGHGHDEQWRLLKDHLHHQQKYEVIFYEEAPRAGLLTPDVLRSMLKESDIAFLVFTGEITDSKGVVHARDNVIHELGLFQGYLGFERAIMLLEEGVYEHSNVHGINQIRFDKGKIKEKYGDIVATIRNLRGNQE
jgi:predicted nucleotide-binding protein